jgi:hypothetical protein
MTTSLEQLLDEFTLYEPDLGRELRESPHLRMFGAGRAEIDRFHALSMQHVTLPAQVAAYQFYAAELQMPPRMHAEVVRSSTQTTARGPAITMSSHVAVSGLVVTPSVLEIEFVDFYRTSRLRAFTPQLPVTARAQAEAWLAEAETLVTLADGNPLDPDRVRALGLLPAWDALELTGEPSGEPALIAGAKILCVALALRPELLPIWRGLDGRAVVQRFVEVWRARRVADFAAAAATLAADPAVFWSAPELPAAPPLDSVAAGAGLGAQLTPPPFWPEHEEGELFAEAATQVYRNVPRRVLKLADPRTGRSGR